MSLYVQKPFIVDHFYDFYIQLHDPCRAVTYNLEGCAYNLMYNVKLLKGYMLHIFVIILLS